jgi:hypothetical protein
VDQPFILDGNQPGLARINMYSLSPEYFTNLLGIYLFLSLVEDENEIKYVVYIPVRVIHTHLLLEIQKLCDIECDNVLNVFIFFITCLQQLLSRGNQVAIRMTALKPGGRPHLQYSQMRPIGRAVGGQ